MVVALHEKGLFSWNEWAATLSAEVKQPDAAADGSDYYEHWLAALEKLLAARGVAQTPEVDSIAAAWQRAAHATPHGHPILLENDPEAHNRSADSEVAITLHDAETEAMVHRLAAGREIEAAAAIKQAVEEALARETLPGKQTAADD